MLLETVKTIEQMDNHELAGAMLGHQCTHPGCTRVGWAHIKVNGQHMKVCAPHFIEYVDGMAAESREAEYDKHHAFGQGM